MRNATVLSIRSNTEDQARDIDIRARTGAIRRVDEVYRPDLLERDAPPSYRDWYTRYLAALKAWKDNLEAGRKTIFARKNPYSIREAMDALDRESNEFLRIQREAFIDEEGGPAAVKAIFGADDYAWQDLESFSNLRRLDEGEGAPHRRLRSAHAQLKALDETPNADLAALSELATASVAPVVFRAANPATLRADTPGAVPPVSLAAPVPDAYVVPLNLSANNGVRSEFSLAARAMTYVRANWGAMTAGAVSSIIIKSAFTALATQITAHHFGGAGSHALAMAMPLVGSAIAGSATKIVRTLMNTHKHVSPNYNPLEDKGLYWREAGKGALAGLFGGVLGEAAHWAGSALASHFHLFGFGHHAPISGGASASAPATTGGTTPPPTSLPTPAAAPLHGPVIPPTNVPHVTLPSAPVASYGQMPVQSLPDVFPGEGTVDDIVAAQKGLADVVKKGLLNDDKNLLRLAKAGARTKNLRVFYLAVKEISYKLDLNKATRPLGVHLIDLGERVSIGQMKQADAPLDLNALKLSIDKLTCLRIGWLKPAA